MNKGAEELQKKIVRFLVFTFLPILVSKQTVGHSDIRNDFRDALIEKGLFKASLAARKVNL